MTSQNLQSQRPKPPFPEQVTQFGQQVPIKRPAQPAVAPIYVLLASEEASYVSGAVIPVTGGQPVLP